MSLFVCFCFVWGAVFSIEPFYHCWNKLIYPQKIVVKRVWNNAQHCSQHKCRLLSSVPKIHCSFFVTTIIYYIDTDEIPGFLLLLKNHIFTARSEDTIFIFHVWGYWCGHGYQHNYPIAIQLLGQARGRFIWNFIHKMGSRCEDGRVLEFFSLLKFWIFSNRKYKHYFLYFSFITLYPSFITFLWQAF